MKRKPTGNRNKAGFTGAGKYHIKRLYMIDTESSILKIYLMHVQKSVFQLLGGPEIFLTLMKNVLKIQKLKIFEIIKLRNRKIRSAL